MAGFDAGSLEVAMGVQPLAELLEQRTHLVEKVATLRARYGAFGTWDNERKILLSQLSATLRAQATRSGAKMTDKSVDEASHAHPDYIDFITTATTDRAAWIRQEAQIEAIDFTINRGQALLRLATRMEVGA